MFGARRAQQKGDTITSKLVMWDCHLNDPHNFPYFCLCWSSSLKKLFSHGYIEMVSIDTSEDLLECTAPLLLFSLVLNKSRGVRGKLSMQCAHFSTAWLFSKRVQFAADGQWSLALAVMRALGFEWHHTKVEVRGDINSLTASSWHWCRAHNKGALTSRQL